MKPTAVPLCLTAIGVEEAPEAERRRARVSGCLTRGTMVSGEEEASQGEGGK